MSLLNFWEHLPLELWCEILKFTNPRSVGSMSRVCKLWKDILQEKIWPLIFESRFGYLPESVVDLRTEFYRIDDFLAEFTFKTTRVDVFDINSRHPSAIAILDDFVAICDGTNRISVVHVRTSAVHEVLLPVEARVTTVCAVFCDTLRAFVCGGKDGRVYVLEHFADAAGGAAQQSTGSWELTWDLDMHPGDVISVRTAKQRMSICS